MWGLCPPRLAQSLLPRTPILKKTPPSTTGLLPVLYQRPRVPRVSQRGRWPHTWPGGTSPSWDHHPRPSLLQRWSRNHRLQSQLGKLLLRDGAILSKQHPMSPAGHLLKTLLDIALESLTHGVLKMKTGPLAYDQIAFNSFMIAPGLPRPRGQGVKNCWVSQAALWEVRSRQDT